MDNLSFSDVGLGDRVAALWQNAPSGFLWAVLVFRGLTFATQYMSGPVRTGHLVDRHRRRDHRRRLTRPIMLACGLAILIAGFLAGGSPSDFAGSFFWV